MEEELYEEVIDDDEPEMRRFLDTTDGVARKHNSEGSRAADIPPVDFL